jgi:hypothetical protein
MSFPMTSGSSMQATIRADPPQVGQISMSILNTRFRRCAQVIEARRSAAAGSSACCRDGLASPTPLGRCHPRAVLAVGREHAVKTRQIHPRLRHQRCKPGDEIQWARSKEANLRLSPLSRISWSICVDNSIMYYSWA